MGAGDLRRVLIAGAEGAVRQQLSRALLAADIFSDCALSVPDALSRLEQRSYGLILLDIALPGGDLALLVSRIEAIEKPRRPVVLAVAESSEEAGRLDVEIVQIVLRRSVGVDQIADLIRNCLRSAAIGTTRQQGEGDAVQPTS